MPHRKGTMCLCGLTVMWVFLYMNDLPEDCPPTVTCQMYADDAVIYVHEELASVVNIFNWLANSCLHLSVNQTVCMFFSKSANTDPDSITEGKRCSVVQEFKY